MRQTLFSADKDHTIMTGGTLKIDKFIHLEQPGRLYLYYFNIGNAVDLAYLHKGIHSLEHCLAYSKDTGSIRAVVEERTGIEGKLVLDCSPYINGTQIGFRITSVAPVELEDLHEIILTALNRTRHYLAEGHSVPFSTARECGQYDFHSSAEALQLIDLILGNQVRVEDISTDVAKQPHSNYFVADLRLLKPKLEGRTSQFFLEPGASHTIAQHLENQVATELDNKQTSIVVGTFGCMTGMYFLFSSEAELEPAEEELYRNTVHHAIYRTLQKMNHQHQDEATQAGLQRSIDNIEQYGCLS